MDLKGTVHLIHFSGRPGGIEVLLPVITGAMPRYRFNGFVINKPLVGDINVYDRMEIPVRYGSGLNFATMISLFRYVRQNRNDIFHAFNAGPLIIFLLQAAGAGRIVYSIHGTVYWKSRRKKLINKVMWYLVLRRQLTFTSNSAYSRAVFRDKIAASTEIKVLYNPVDSEKFSPATLPGHSGLRIAYAGRLCEGKNLEKWISLASELHGSLPEAMFELYGYGPLLQKLEQQVRNREAEGYIHFRGYTEDMAGVYRNADFLLFLSEYESFGNVAVESILCGTPVIVSDIPSMREIFSDFPEFIIRADDKMKEAVLKKLSEAEKLKGLAAKAREQFLSRFSVEAHTEALDRIYSAFNE